MTDNSTYIEGRLEKQREWHSRKASRNKNWHYVTEIVTMGAGAIIPVINILDVSPVKAISTALAAVVVVSSAISKLFKFQENWLSFRTLAEALEREKELYQHQVGDYAVAQNLREKLLVERIENMLATTTSQFLSVHRAEQVQIQPTTNQGESTTDI